MTRPMEALLVFAACLIGAALGAMVAEARHMANLKAQARLEPIRWVIDADTRLAVNNLISDEPAVRKFATKSDCEAKVFALGRKFPGIHFRPRCIREDGVRSIYKPYALRETR
jgi:hypothetical protein